FENLEGPIRINVSAKKAYLMESQFVDFRKMIKSGVSVEELKASMDSLKKEMYEVLPELEEGTHIVAEETAPVEEINREEDIDPKWKSAVKYIQNNFKKALEVYNPDNSIETRRLVQDSQFEGYRNTFIEIAIRKNLSRDKEAEIQSQFTEIIQYIYTKPLKEDLRKKLDSLVYDIINVTKGLPIPEKKKELMKDDEIVQDKKDFKNVSKSLYKVFDEAFALVDKGNSKKAISNIQEAYFDIFEASGLENAIGSKDPNLKARLEGYFGKIIAMIKASKSKDELSKIFNAFKVELDTAVISLNKTEVSFLSAFIQSLLLILREGFEALLIVTAIIAYLVKSGNGDKMRIVYTSLTTAVVLSFLTAWGMNVAFGQAAGENRELLEGATMLVACVLLLYVAYWLVSNAQGKKWINYINSQVKESLSKGSEKALWFTVFLAVYREGAELVLFYQALLSNVGDSNGYMAISGGFISGCILLVVIYFILKFTAIKLPIKPFFLFTGILIYIMAFIFVGQGLAELVEARVFLPTLLDSQAIVGLIEQFPNFARNLGIYPYIETIIAQAFVLILGFIGIILMKNKNQIVKENV
ncbi:MAG: FTR1 family iron permease, partial [Arcobacter sp.]|nr:FTR1 family iron permease [Arcobacter sp.]